MSIYIYIYIYIFSGEGPLGRGIADLPLSPGSGGVLPTRAPTLSYSFSIY